MASIAASEGPMADRAAWQAVLFHLLDSCKSIAKARAAVGEEEALDDEIIVWRWVNKSRKPGFSWMERHPGGRWVPLRARGAVVSFHGKEVAEAAH
jgi:hypothetical protein